MSLLNSLSICKAWPGRFATRLVPFWLATVVAVLGTVFLATAEDKTSEEAETSEETRESLDQADSEWRPLFDGESLAGWEVSNFAGHGEVRAEDGELILEQGLNLTGVTWTNDYPKIDYEIQLEAKRVDGYDFFCGLTFPVGDSFCSLIIGGWGGGVYGLSSINGQDASMNETTGYQRFEADRWYEVRLRVTQEKIQAWLEGEELVDVPLEDREFSVRIDVEEAKPLGFSAWRTTAALRNIRIRELDPSS